MKGRGRQRRADRQRAAAKPSVRLLAVGEVHFGDISRLVCFVFSSRALHVTKRHKRHDLVILACHFRATVDLPKNSPTCSPAYITEETGLRVISRTSVRGGEIFFDE